MTRPMDMILFALLLTLLFIGMDPDLWILMEVIE